MPIKLANNASGTIATAISTTDTGIVLTSGNGALFPSLAAGEYFYATLASIGGTLEIVKVTARSGDSLTVVRAQEGTTAAGFASGARFELRVTAQSVRDAIDDVDAAAVDFTPYASISSTNVQSAIQEIVDEVNILSTNTFTVEVITATAAQTVFNLSNPYVVGSVNLSVYMNGLRIRNVVDYVETNSTRVTLTSGAQAGDELTFVAGREVNDGLAASSVSFTPAGSGAIARTAQEKMRDTVSVKDFGGVCDGLTDDTAALFAAQSAVALSGGTVLVNGPTKFSSTLTLVNGINWCFAGGAKLIWAGNTSSTCVTTGNQVYRDTRWEGFTLDTGPAFTGIALYIRSTHNVQADVIRLITTGTTSTAIRMWADSTSGGDAMTKRNTTAVCIGSIVQQGQCGTLMDFDGLSSGYVGDPQVVTLNTIGSVFAENCAQYGLRMRNWTDNNCFSGMTRVALNDSNAVGLQHGEATSLGVYMNQFGILAVDTFGTLSGRIGVKVENSKLLQIKALYQSPAAEGGEFVSTIAAESYDVSFFRDSDKRIIHYRRLMRAASEGFNSSDTIVLSDDTAGSFNVAEGVSVSDNVIFVLTISTGDANANGIAWLKCKKSPGFGAPEISLIAGGANFDVTTGPLTGTTGTDTKFTVSANNDGKFYIENRLGFTVSLTTHIAAWMQAN